MPFFDSSGVRIHYEVEGDGPPVVLVHGLTSSIQQNWRRPGVMDALAGAGLRVVALDCRGHGLSDEPYDSASYGGTKMGDDVVALMGHLGIDVAGLLGYSMGGAIATGVLARRPERIRRAIIAGVGDWVLRANSTAGSDRASATARTRRFARAAVGSPILRGLSRISGNDFAALAALRNATRTGVDARALAAVRCPVLILVGSGDRGADTPTRLAAAIPGARIVKVPGNHVSAVANPAFRRTVVQFFSE